MRAFAAEIGPAAEPAGDRIDARRDDACRDAVRPPHQQHVAARLSSSSTDGASVDSTSSTPGCAR